MVGLYRGTLTRLCHGVVFEPRVARRGPDKWVCVSRSKDNLWLHVICATPFKPLEADAPPAPEEPVGYQSIAPNMLHVVEAVHADRPGLIRNPHAFTAVVATRLHAVDERWGLNGKRGNPEDPSEDCVAFKAPGSPAGGVEIYDIIAGANGPDPKPAWIDQTQETVAKGTVGVWVAPPVAVVTPQPPVAPHGVPVAGLTQTDLLTALAPVLVRLERLEAALAGLPDVVTLHGALQDEVLALGARVEELAEITVKHIDDAKGRIDAVLAAVDKLPKSGCRLRW